MRLWVLAFAVLWVSVPAYGKPTAGFGATVGSFNHNVRFFANDAEDSDALGVSGMCRASIDLAGSDVVSLYHVPTQTTPAASGDLIVTFTSSSMASIPFTAKYFYVKAVSTTSATGGSKLNVSCSNIQLSSTVDPSYTVRFESAVAGDDPMVMAYTDVIVKELDCFATGSPTDHIVTVNECDTSGGSCSSTGLTLEFDAAGVGTDNSPTSDAAAFIEQGNYWGIHTNDAAFTAADFLDCTVYAERG